MPRILTAWHHDGDPDLMPNVILSADEYLLDDNPHFWDETLAAEAAKWGAEVSELRLMWITVPDKAVVDLFATPEHTGATEPA